MPFNNFVLCQKGVVKKRLVVLLKNGSNAGVLYCALCYIVIVK